MFDPDDTLFKKERSRTGICLLDSEDDTKENRNLWRKCTVINSFAQRKSRNLLLLIIDRKLCIDYVLSISLKCPRNRAEMVKYKQPHIFLQNMFC